MISKDKQKAIDIKLAYNTYNSISDIRDFDEEDYDYICEKYNDGYKPWGDFLRTLVNHGIIPVASCAGHVEKEEYSSYVLLFAPDDVKITKLVMGLFKIDNAEIFSSIIHFDNEKGIALYFPFKDRDAVIKNISMTLNSDEIDMKIYDEVKKLSFLNDTMRLISLNGDLGVCIAKRNEDYFLTLKESNFYGADFCIYEEYIDSFREMVYSYIHEYFMYYSKEEKAYIPTCYTYKDGYDILKKYVEQLLLYKEENKDLFYDNENIKRKLLN